MHSSLTRQPSNLLNKYKTQQSLSLPNIQYKHRHNNPLLHTTNSHFHTNATYCYHHYHNDDESNCLKSSQIKQGITNNIMENTNKSIVISTNRNDDDNDSDDYSDHYSGGSDGDEQIVINSILYKRASSSRMVVDIGSQITQALLTGNRTNHHEHHSTSLDKLDASHGNFQNKKRACMSDLEKLLSCEKKNNNVAEWYVMSTVINGSIEHHISGFCANLLNVILKETKLNDNENDCKDKLEEEVENSDSNTDCLMKYISNRNDDNCSTIDNVVSFNYNHHDSDDDDSGDDSFIQFISDDENDYQHIQESLSYDIDDDLSCENSVDDTIEDESAHSDNGDEIVANYSVEFNHEFDNRNSNINVENQNTYTNNMDTTDGEIYIPNTSQLHNRLKLQRQMSHYYDKPRKKVCFNNCPVVHVMHTWDYAYRAARKGHWEMYARDRARFKLRIQRCAEQLEPILRAEHRHKIYCDRFLPYYQQQSSEMPMPSSKIQSTQCKKYNIEMYTQNVNKKLNKQRTRRLPTTAVVSVPDKFIAHTATTKTKWNLLERGKCGRHRRRRNFKTPFVLFYCYIF